MQFKYGVVKKNFPNIYNLNRLSAQPIEPNFRYDRLKMSALETGMILNNSKVKVTVTEFRNFQKATTKFSLRNLMSILKNHKGVGTIRVTKNEREKSFHWNYKFSLCPPSPQFSTSIACGKLWGTMSNVTKQKECAKHLMAFFNSDASRGPNVYSLDF